MPPKVDVQTEGRILKAAERLLRARGEPGLTLRAIAREAGTTTPTVYKRFRNKRALRLALSEKFAAQAIAEFISAPTLEEAFRRYVRFSEKHPNQYRLLWDSWTEVLHPDNPRPMRAWVLSQLVQRFGGAPEDYLLLFFGLLLLSHGAAMLLTVPGDEIARQVVRDSFPPIVDAMLRNPQILQQLQSSGRFAKDPD